MKHWTKQTDLTKEATSNLAVECVILDDNEQPQQRRQTRLSDLLRGLMVTLPVATHFTVDRPGAI